MGPSCSSAQAGGGPENVFLVVNSADRDSLTIANKFIRYRNIPETSVFYVPWESPGHRANVEEFTGRVLKPTLKAIADRKLSKQIDYIVYSSGFPYRIDFNSQMGERLDQYPSGSITGLTYLYQYTLGGKLGTIAGSKELPAPALTMNAYSRNLRMGPDAKTRGFRARYGLDLTGARTAEENGQRYYLSMMLAYTGGNNNNTMDQITRYLRDGAKADGTEPKGTIYYVRNPNIRSAVRQGRFDMAVELLDDIGVKAEVIEGNDGEKEALPIGKKDVQGAMIGYFKVAWGLTGSDIQPGAIVENFTSYGGRMDGTHSQTMLSLFLRYGAVASSGTVVEPYAHPTKFPDPLIHVHYARGCSVAESFYQSVWVPYQLLIVGDPLCQPWAAAPVVKLTGLNTKKPVTGTITFNADATSKKGHAIRNFDVFVDGKLFTRSLPDKEIKIDTTRLVNGYHELRVVAIEDTPIETQGRFVTAFVSANVPKGAAPGTGMLSVAATPTSRDGFYKRGQRPAIRVRSSGARQIRIYRGQELMGATKGEAGTIVIDPDKLGGGRVKLRAAALPADRKYKPVFGFPFQVTFE